MTGSGFSAGLARLHGRLAAHVETGKVPGLISLVARHDPAGIGEVHVDVIGTKAFDDADPMPRDAIFRIASLTKPITAAAAMILVDDGVLALDTPIDGYLPELADRRVLRRLDSPLDDTVAATRAITLDDLLTYRMGFGAIMAPPDTYPIQAAERELQLGTLGPPWPPTPHSPDEWIRHFASLPLMHQPGEQWMYNTGSQVLGVLLERAAGQPLEAFLRQRLFDPLGMRDTGFRVSPDQRSRFTTAYAPDPASGTLRVLDGVDDSYWSEPPALPNAAGWLVSTIDDFWAFVSMLLADGVREGERILSERSIESMTTDHLTSEQRASAGVFLGEHDGWGLGMLVPTAQARASAIRGGFGWDGGTGTTWRSDRAHGLTGVLFTQRAMTSPEPPALFDDFWDGVYRSVSG
jgi:CubicO group peptidase (beta-lactamase class C family)